jgi:hypothetical protein
VESRPGGKNFSTVMGAIGKITAPPGQATGAANPYSETLQPVAENTLAGKEASGSQAAEAGGIGSFARGGGVEASKSKKKADDSAPQNATNSAASTRAGIAALIPLGIPVLVSSFNVDADLQTSSVASELVGSGLVGSGLVGSGLAGSDGPPAKIGQKNEGGATGDASAHDLAFAVRFKSDPSTQNNTDAGSKGNDSAGANGKTLPQTADGSGSVDLKSTAAPAGSFVGGAALAAPNTAPLGAPSSQQVSQHVANQPAGSAAADSSSPANSSGVDEIKPASESAPPALRSVQVQITGQDNQRVDVKLIERPGALSMSVRAADGSLTRSLQEHLPELTTKLAEQQMPAEWWVPKTPSTAPASEAAASGDTTKQGDSRSQGQSGLGGQDSGKQQGGRQGDQPNWVDELTAMNNSKTNRKEYIWHQ